jgi:hypothetical protein
MSRTVRKRKTKRGELDTLDYADPILSLSSRQGELLSNLVYDIHLIQVLSKGNVIMQKIAPVKKKYLSNAPPALMCSADMPEYSSELKAFWESHPNQYTLYNALSPAARYYISTFMEDYITWARTR